MRARGDLVVAEARRGVGLEAGEQRAVDRHLAGAAAALVVVLRGGLGGRAGLAVGRARIEAQRDQLVLNFAHIVMAERKRRKRGVCLRSGGRLPRNGRRWGGGRRIGLVGALRAHTSRPADQQSGGGNARNTAPKRGLANDC